ncbi:MAG: NAD+ synthase [Candidatus Firestonebacteria bacterium]
MRIALAQINPIVGDLKGNCLKIKGNISKSTEIKADIVVFPELSITGYPPEDLLLKSNFIRDNLNELKEITVWTKDITAVVGFVDKVGKDIYNSAAVISESKIKGIYHKIYLPNYGVFDEQRYFKSGNNPFTFNIKGISCGIIICEDIWHEDGPLKLEASAGAKVLFVLNASPYHAGKVHEREKVIQKQAKENKIFIAYINMVGGQDELIFDGGSMIVDPNGKIISQSECFKEDLLFYDIPLGEKENKLPLPEKKFEKLSLAEEVYNALLLGLKDYVNKNDFKKVVVALSGGIDSSLVGTLAVDALGKENVIGVFMPSKYSSIESREDAEKLSKNLGVKLLNIPIQEIFETYIKNLNPVFSNLKKDITEENLQARIRGNIIMALSNKFGWLVLTTGNKSEMSTGYATLYGDMAGGFAVIKDVPKTLVYELCKFKNTNSQIIPERILTKVPTAELKPNQKDSDTLPPYPELDPILKYYIEEDKEAKEIIKYGFNEKTVYKVLKMVDKSEYKRRQSPPGIKITPKAFGKDRRIPITNKYN